MGRTKAHQRYRVEGKVVPGVTTIIGNLGWNKNALISWARREALAGNDPDKIRDQSADRGTLAHALIEEHLTGRVVDRSLYPEADLEIAENAFLAYLEWEGAYQLEVVGSEIQLAHPELMYGGTIDLLALLDGELALIDFKTTNGVYVEHRVQIAAYEALVKYHLGNGGLNGLNGDGCQVHLLQLSKKDGTFSHHSYRDLSKEWEIFEHCLALHQLKKLTA